MTDLWDHYASIPAPAYDPFKATRLVMGIDPAGGPESAVVYVGGRGHGKVARMQAQLEGSRAAISWLDEYAAFIAELHRDPYKQVRDVVESARAVPKKQTAPAVETVRWACKSPTALVYPKGSMGWYAFMAEARMMDAFAEDNRKLNARWNAKVSAVQELLGVGKHGTND